MMKYTQRYVPGILASLLLVLVVLATTAPAQTVDVYLRAEAFSLNVAGGPIPAWGFAEDSGFGAGDGTLSVPGPVIRATAGDTLNIHLDNNLGEPISIHILGQAITNNTGPVWTTGTSATISATGDRPAMDYTSRVRSFTHETAPANGTAVLYEFANLKAGTYCYQSSSNPGKQVQMGLFGVLIVDAAVSEVYTGITYDKEVVVVFHEIDPVIQAAIDAGTYGAVPGATIGSSIFRHSIYFLINGMTYPDAGLAPINTAINAGEDVLLRFVNAGFETRAPQMPTMYMSLVGEDGTAYAYARDTYGVELPAGKTMEAILQPATDGTIPLYDARLNLSNAGDATLGGMFAYLDVGAAAVNTPPVANDDPTNSTDFETAIIIDVLANDTDAETDPLTVSAVSQGTNGSVVINVDDTVTYTPNPGWTGIDTFAYTANDGQFDSNLAIVTVTTGANTPPVANDDPTNPTAFETAIIIDVLANDTDAESHPLTVSSVTQGTNGSVAINVDDTVTYTPNAAWTGIDTFTYTANDGYDDSNLATVTVTTAANTAPVANDDPDNVTNIGLPVIIDVLANDTDAESHPLTVSSVTQGTNGSVAINVDDTVTYTPNAAWMGIDTFTYTANDGYDDSTAATVTVRTNEPPVARGDRAATTVNTGTTIDVLSNDTDDVPLVGATIIITSPPSKGGNAVVNAGQIDYTPPLGHTGAEGFRYTVEDTDGAVSNEGRVKVVTTP